MSATHLTDCLWPPHEWMPQKSMDPTSYLITYYYYIKRKTATKRQVYNILSRKEASFSLHLIPLHTTIHREEWETASLQSIENSSFLISICPYLLLLPLFSVYIIYCLILCIIILTPTTIKATNNGRKISSLRSLCISPVPLFWVGIILCSYTFYHLFYLTLLHWFFSESASVSSVHKLWCS